MNFKKCPLACSLTLHLIIQLCQVFNYLMNKESLYCQVFTLSIIWNVFSFSFIWAKSNSTLGIFLALGSGIIPMEGLGRIIWDTGYWTIESRLARDSTSSTIVLAPVIWKFCNLRRTWKEGQNYYSLNAEPGRKKGKITQGRKENQKLTVGFGDGKLNLCCSWFLVPLRFIFFMLCVFKEYCFYNTDLLEGYVFCRCKLGSF